MLSTFNGNICANSNLSAKADYMNFSINVTYDDTLRALHAIKLGSTGPDGFTGDITSELSSLLAKPLHIIYVEFICKAVLFPNVGKCARVIPLCEGKGS